MLLVTFAVPHESRFLRRRPMGDSVRILHTGIGIEAAAACLQKAIAELRPTAVLSSGFAGGLDPRLQVGDLIADVSHSSPGLLASVPPDIQRGVIYSATEPIDSVAAKAKLYARTSAAAVDMETSAIAAECVHAGLPLLVLRAISDAAADPIPVPLSISWDLKTQRPRPAALLLWLARHPTRIGSFIRFLRGTNTAAQRLGEVVGKVAEEMGRVRAH